MFFLLSDVNECRSGSNDCEELCVNTEGSYECDCSVGYTHATDGLNCIGENERQTDTVVCSLIMLMTLVPYYV